MPSSFHFACFLKQQALHLCRLCTHVSFHFTCFDYLSRVLLIFSIHALFLEILIRLFLLNHYVNLCWSVGVAVKYVLQAPKNSVAGIVEHVLVQALDQFGNVASAETRGVTLVTSDAQRTLVPILNGQGTVAVTTTLAHLVALSLSDSASTGLNVASSSSINFLPGLFHPSFQFFPLQRLTAPTPVVSNLLFCRFFFAAVDCQANHRSLGVEVGSLD